MADAAPSSSSSTPSSFKLPSSLLLSEAQLDVLMAAAGLPSSKKCSVEILYDR
jgi:hypothetical protein